MLRDRCLAFPLAVLLFTIFVPCSALAIDVTRGDCQDQWIPFEEAPDDRVTVTCLFDDGRGEALYVGGTFEQIGGNPISFLGRWDGTSWEAVGSGLNGRVDALYVYDDGSGPALYVGGDFSMAGDVDTANIARWDGVQWQGLDAGVGGPVIGIGSYESEIGPLLLVSGNFTQINSEPVLYLASWDGTQWGAFGPGLDGPARVFAEFDDGTGPGLYIAGDFRHVGGVLVNRIVRFDGQEWERLAVDSTPGFNSRVEGMAVHDDGNGQALFVAGQFTLASGQPAQRIVKWDGQNWFEIGGGVNQRIRALTLFDSGSGPELYIGGLFTVAAPSEPVFYSARWDGQAWHWLSGGTNDDVVTLTAWEIDGQPALYAGGTFTTAGKAGGIPATNIAAWSPCFTDTPPCPADLNGDGSISLPDLNLVLSNFGTSGGNGDGNGDGQVNLLDLNLVLSQFGQSCP